MRVALHGPHAESQRGDAAEQFVARSILPYGAYDARLGTLLLRIEGEVDGAPPSLRPAGSTSHNNSPIPTILGFSIFQIDQHLHTSFAVGVDEFVGLPIFLQRKTVRNQRREPDTPRRDLSTAFR